MKKYNKKINLGIASALLLSSIVPVIVVNAEEDTTKVIVKDNPLASAKVSNVAYTVIEAKNIFNLDDSKNYKYGFEVKDKEGNVVTDVLDVKNELNNLHIQGLKDGAYDLDITISEIPETEGTTTTETTYTLSIDSFSEEFKISNVLNQTVVIGNTDFVVSDANNGILISKDKIDISAFEVSGKTLEEYVGSRFNFDANANKILSVQKTIDKGVREFSNVELQGLDGTIVVKVKNDTLLQENGGKFYFQETNITVNPEPTLKITEDYVMATNSSTLDLSTVITNERGDEFDYMLVGNNLTHVNATVKGKILKLNSISPGTESIDIKVLKEDGNFVTFTINVVNNFTDNGMLVEKNVEKVNYVNVTSNKNLRELNSNIYDYNNVILYRDNKDILLRDNLIDFEIASVTTGHFILGSYDSAGNLVEVHDLKYKKEDVDIPDVPEVPEIPAIEVPVWVGSIPDVGVDVSREFTIDLNTLHNSKDVTYEITSDKSNISSHAISENGVLVITGLVKGESEYSIKMTNSAGESEVLKFKVEVKVLDEVLTAPVWIGSVPNTEVNVSKDVTIDLNALHNSKDVTYEVTADKNNLSTHKVLSDGKLVINGISKGEVEYSIKMKNSVGESKVLKFKVNVVEVDVIPVWTDTVSPKEVNVSKDVIIDLKSLHNSKNVAYEITSNKSNVTSHKVLTDDKLVITGLTEGDVEYSIKMKNTAGDSEVLKFVVKVQNEYIVTEKSLNVGKGVIKTFNLSDVVESKYVNSNAYTFRVVNGGNQLILSNGLITVDNREGINLKPTIEVYEGSKKVHTYNVSLLTNSNEFGLHSFNDTITLSSIGEVNHLDLSKYVNGLTSSSEVILSNNGSAKNLKVLVRGTKLELTSTGYGNEVVKFKVKDGNKETKEFTLNVNIEQQVSTGTVKLVGNEPYFKSISSFFVLKPGENITKLVINYRDASIVGLELVDGLLRFTPKKDGETVLEVIAVTDKGVEYVSSIKVTVDYDEKKAEEDKDKDKEESEKPEPPKLPVDVKFTSSESKNSLNIDFADYTLGQKLKDDFEIKISNGKAYVGGSLIDVKIPAITNSTYIFMKVGGELVSVPFHRTSNGDLLIDVNYEGELVFSEEVSSYGNLYGHYAEKFIEELSKKKVLEQNWTSESNFAVGKDVKGNEFTNVITRALGYSVDDSKSVLVSNNIVSSNLFDSINSSDTISREDAVSVLHNLIKFKNPSITSTNTSSFVDFNEVTASKKTSVSTLQSLGVIHGKPGLVFDAKGNLTRGQFSKIVYLSLNHVN